MIINKQVNQFKISLYLSILTKFFLNERGYFHTKWMMIDPNYEKIV